MNEPIIYLDNNATTQPTPAVVDAMLPYLRECFFNASSASASITGADVPRRLAASAMQEMLNAEEAECFVFTSGATEANNWVLSALRGVDSQSSLVISTIEHPSISEPASQLSNLGVAVSETAVNANGQVSLEALRELLNKNTALVSIMAANNETGVLQPIEEIGALVREKSPSAIFHTDATQAVGKIPIDLQNEWQEVDLLSFSAHKFHGPKGVGGLYIRPGCEIPPLLLGGGQEAGLRSGTTNTAGLAGLAAAARQFRPSAKKAISEVRDKFEAALSKRFSAIRIHGQEAPRLPNTSCFSVPGIVADRVAEELVARNIIVGTGSACSAGSMHPPKTLLAMNVDYEVARTALRVSLNASSTFEQLVCFIDALDSIVSFSFPVTSNVQR